MFNYTTIGFDILLDNDQECVITRGEALNENDPLVFTPAHQQISYNNKICEWCVKWIL